MYDNYDDIYEFDDEESDEYVKNLNRLGIKARPKRERSYKLIEEE